MRKQLQNAREEYRKLSLDKSDVSDDPLHQFSVWLEQYKLLEVQDYNAMTLCTTGSSGYPSARVVLLKGIREDGFEFFTNYYSKKAHDIEENPKVSLSFYWPELERQVRVEGLAVKLTSEESDAYFAVRPRENQIGTWASPQSDIIETRKVLEERETLFKEKFAGKDVPRPDYWGGFCVHPERIEFWQGRPGRLHDRISYEKKDEKWKIFRLAP